jgi:hypothetical protein
LCASPTETAESVGGMITEGLSTPGGDEEKEK